MAKDDIAGPHRGGPGSRKVGGRCPTCEAPATQRFRPFCSKRCQDVDLGRWLRGSYRVPTEEAPGDRGLGAESDADDSPYGGHA